MSMYKEIKTVTTGATEQAVTFTDEHSYVYAKNIGDTDVYLSALSGIVAGADDVALCAAGDTAQICPVGKTIYVLGASTIEFHATNTDNSPFNSVGKGGGSGDGVHFKGSTTTALTDGATTNPITIDGSSYTAVMGDMVIYSNKEFLFDGTAWREMGDLSDTVGQKYYVSGVAKGEIFNSYFTTVSPSKNKASGEYSHAEGYYTEASGNYSHAEGADTAASGEYSHAEGQNTIASGFASHVSGKFNDFQTGDLFEIGNGTSYNARSNIVEVSSTYLNVNGAIKANGVAYITPYTTMPTVTAAMVGQIAQYMGVTNSTYTRGWFYEAVSDGESDPTYSWEVINFPKVPGGGDALTATQNGVYVPTSAYGYSSVTVNVPFYARTDATLADVSTVEGDEMHIEPTAGTSYYPRLFLMATPWPNPESVAPVDVGKLYEPDSGSWEVKPYIDIIDKAMGQSVTGYPQQVHTSASFAINSGGYCRVKSWSYASDKISVTTTRWNTTYSNPIDDTYVTQNDVDDWCSAYATGPYAIYDDLAKGTCGTNATWVLYKSGQLVISGTGAVTDGGWDDTKVVDVMVGEGITSLSNNLFQRCTNLRTVHFPSTLTSIGSYAFESTALTSVSIPEGVTQIRQYTFRYCSRLTTVTIPSTVTSIGGNSFAYTGTQTVTIYATTPPSTGSYSPGWSLSTLQAIYVPYDSVDAYKTAWSSYASKIQAIQE